MLTTRSALPAKPSRLRTGFTTLLLAAGLLAAEARADVTYADLMREVDYTQLDAAGTLQQSGAVFTARAYLASVGDYDQGSLNTPLPPALALTPAPGPTLNYHASFASQSAMDAALPTGLYSFALKNSATAATGSISVSYAADAYPLGVPTLSGASFNALQGLRPDGALTLSVQPLVPDPTAAVSDAFLSINRVSDGALMFSADTAVTGSALLPAGTLAQNTAYRYTLEYYDAVPGADPLTGLPTGLIFVQTTSAQFSTAQLPEPGQALLLGIGVLALLAGGRFGRARPGDRAPGCA